jgi:hypothetical protein
MSRLYEWRCQNATCRVLLMELIAGPGTEIRHKCRKCGTLNVMRAPGQIAATATLPRRAG